MSKKREPNDHTGHVIDAANDLLGRLTSKHCDLFNDGHVKRDGGAEVLHSLVMAWIDSEADAGHVSREAPEVDAISTAIAKLSARMQSRRVTKALEAPDADFNTVLREHGMDR